jgi:hypothetical protein
MSLSGGNVLAVLVDRFPQLREGVQGFYTDGTLPDLHTAFGMVVMEEFLLPKLDSGDPANERELEQIFELFEEMACSGDDELTNVVEVTVCESLGDSTGRLEQSRALMGPRTLELSHRAERTLGRE